MLRFLKKVTQRDATLDNLKELETKYRELSEKGRLNKEQSEHYGKMIDDYKAEFKGFTHKEQKAGW